MPSALLEENDIDLEYLFLNVHNFHDVRLYDEIFAPTLHVIDALARNSHNTLTYFAAYFDTAKQASIAEKYITAENKFKNLVECDCFLCL